MPGLIGIKDCFRNCEHLRDTNPQLGRHPGRVRYRLDHCCERAGSVDVVVRRLVCTTAPRLGSPALPARDYELRLGIAFAAATRSKLTILTALWQSAP